MRNHWIGVVSRSHVRIGVQGGFVQLNHGKKAPVRRLQAGDMLAMYSPRESYPDGPALQAFTAIGIVRSDEIYQVEMSPGFKPYRVDVDFFACVDAPIKPLIEHLSFITSKTHWGAAFRFGMLQVPQDDFARIADAMRPAPVPDTLFETARLRCRHWRAADLEPLFEVYSDPVAMRWVGDGEPITRAGCAQWLEVTQRNYALRGYGMFALEERGSGRVIGFGGLVHPAGQAEAELKCALLRSHWGQGLASEIVPALLACGAARFGLNHVIATVAQENLASQRVLAKAGLRLLQHRPNDDGTVTHVFEWHAPAAEGSAARPAVQGGTS